MGVLIGPAGLEMLPEQPTAETVHPEANCILSVTTCSVRRKHPQPAGCAQSRAAAGPSSSSTPNPASSSTGTPSASAFSYLDPGLSPAIKKPVFFDTEPATFPPLACTASAASSLVRPASVPVITTVTPASGSPDADAPAAPSAAGPSPVKPGSASMTPASRHFVTMAACQSTPNQSRTEPAIVGPTSSTSDQLLGRRRRDRVDRAERGGQRAGGGGPDMPDRQRDQDPPQRAAARLVQVVHQLARVGGQACPP